MNNVFFFFHGYVFKVLASCGGDKTICLWAKDESGEWALRAKLVDAHERTVRKVSLQSFFFVCVCFFVVLTLIEGFVVT